MTIPKCLFCECDAVFDFGLGNLICSACLESRILRLVRVEPVAPGPHHPVVSAAATLSQGCPSLGVAVSDSDPSTERRRIYHYRHTRNV